MRPGLEERDPATFMEKGSAEERGFEVEMVNVAPFTDFQGSVVTFSNEPPN